MSDEDRIHSEKGWIPPEVRHHPEFQSALVRMGIWLFAAGYIGLGAWTGYYRVATSEYLVLFCVYLVVFLGLAIDVIRRPVRPVRRYLALALDISASSLAIFLTKEAISPFYLLYIWIFISYGTRFGRRDLVFASGFSVVAYNLVLIELGEWQRHTFEAFFFLLLLALLPLYQFALLRKVEQARLEAERANQARGDFLSTMTHELRTPLTGVIGMTQLLEGTPLRPDQREYVQSIASSAHLLRVLIGDVLDLSKIEARKLHLEQVPFSPRSALLGVCYALQGQALDKGLELVCEIERAVPLEVRGDEMRVRQVLFNLIGNAVKFTEQGQILVRCRVAQADVALPRTHLLLEVEDSGIGIAPEALPRVFDSFWQADDSTTRRYGGSGLGTTIARDLVRLMGGAIDLDSEVGRGSRFWVKLPLLAEGFTAALAGVSPVLEGRRALVFETNAASRGVILRTCEDLGMRCQPIEHIGDLGRLARDRDALDVMILADSPAGEDLAALQRLLSGVIGKPVPFLLLTYPGRGTERGPDAPACLNKPFAPEAMAEALTGVIGGERTSRTGTPGAPAPVHLPEPARGLGRILVAEDNPIAAKVITTLLQRQGYDTTLVLDGEEALRKAEEEVFDLAFVDLRMPKIDGLDFARRQRQREAGLGHLPIIALTANAAEDIRQQCLAAGMDDFLAKPVDPGDLSRTLARYLLPAGEVSANP
jgi:two-component system, sensor histidine kinase RpfC